MLKGLFFKLIDVIMFFRPKDYTIVQKLTCIERGPTHQKMVPCVKGTDEIWYTFGGKVYRTRTWPLKKTGFVVPWTKSSPELPWFRAYAGPKRDFHGNVPEPLPCKILRFPYPTVEFTNKGFSLKIKCGYLFKYHTPVNIISLFGTQKSIQTLHTTV